MALAPFLDRAAALVRTGQLDAAEDLCVEAARADSADPQGWMALAEVRGLKNDPIGTMTALRGACRAAPADADVLAACGGTALGLGLGLGGTLAGVRWLRAALRSNPAHLPAMRDLATIVRMLAQRPQPARRPVAAPGGGVPVSAIPHNGDSQSEAERKAQWREIGLGAQILRDLGISSIRLLTSVDHHYVGLGGFGIEIVSTEAIER